MTVKPVLAFEETGGSTGGCKHIPCTDSAMQEFRSGLHAWLDDLCQARPALAQGRMYWSLSPAGRPAGRHTVGGLPIGLPSDAAYFGSGVGALILQSLAVPLDLARCTDFATWRQRTLHHLLACEDFRMVSVWSPTFWTTLMRHVREEGAALARSLSAADLCTPERARWVAEVLAMPEPDFARLWPGLCVIGCWDQASAAAPARELREWFPQVWVQGKGLLATEGLISLPLHDLPFPVLAVEAGYVEFRAVDGQVHGLEGLQTRGVYEPILSNGAGLYRYALGDWVRVAGWSGQAPLREFLGRTGTTDLCGEKLTQPFIAGLLQALLRSQPARFAALATERLNAGAPRYRLVLDQGAVHPLAAALVASAGLSWGASHGGHWAIVLSCALAFLLTGNPLFALLHEAVHGVFACRKPSRLRTRHGQPVIVEAQAVWQPPASPQRASRPGKHAALGHRQMPCRPAVSMQVAGQRAGLGQRCEAVQVAEPVKPGHTARTGAAHGKARPHGRHVTPIARQRTPCGLRLN
ncbi:MAG: GH3 auxin-responsive promoter family protein [Pseudomonadota bacterium]